MVKDHLTGCMGTVLFHFFTVLFHFFTVLFHFFLLFFLIGVFSNKTALFLFPVVIFSSCLFVVLLFLYIIVEQWKTHQM